MVWPKELTTVWIIYLINIYLINTKCLGITESYERETYTAYDHMDKIV